MHIKSTGIFHVQLDFKDSIPNNFSNGIVAEDD